MRTANGPCFAAAWLAAVFLVCPQPLKAADGADLIRDVLRQQSGAAQAGCAGVQRVVSAGTDAGLVVRTAVELGYNPCQVIRCALEATTELQQPALCERVIRGAVEAGVPVDVISRCSGERCDPTAVAALLGDVSLDPYYCYLMPRQLTAPELLPPPPPVIDQALPRAQASPFRF